MLDAKPASIPNSRPRGAKGQGLKYERDFAKALPSAMHGQWFEFWDANGRGWCQPDFLLRVGETIVVLECKYTWTPLGRGQIGQLYKPVVEAAFGARAVGVVVCKHLIPEAPKSVPGLEEAIRLAVAGKESVLHWLAGPPWTDLITSPIAAAPVGRLASGQAAYAARP